MIHLNKAIINIRTTQVDINTKQDEVIELITEGKFYKKSDAYYLVYDESEISGMQGTTTTLKIKDNQVVLALGIFIIFTYLRNFYNFSF